MPTTDPNIPTLPLSPDSCPISTLLSQRVVHMSDQELENYVMQLRSCADSPQTLLKAVRRGVETKTKKEKKKSPSPHGKKYD